LSEGDGEKSAGPLLGGGWDIHAVKKVQGPNAPGPNAPKMTEL